MKRVYLFIGLLDVLWLSGVFLSLLVYFLFYKSAMSTINVSPFNFLELTDPKELLQHTAELDQYLSDYNSFLLKIISGSILFFLLLTVFTALFKGKGYSLLTNREFLFMNWFKHCLAWFTFHYLILIGIIWFVNSNAVALVMLTQFLLFILISPVFFFNIASELRKTIIKTVRFFSLNLLNYILRILLVAIAWLVLLYVPSLLLTIFFLPFLVSIWSLLAFIIWHSASKIYLLEWFKCADK